MDKYMFVKVEDYQEKIDRINNLISENHELVRKGVKDLEAIHKLKEYILQDNLFDYNFDKYALEELIDEDNSRAFAMVNVEDMLEVGITINEMVGYIEREYTKKYGK